MPDLYGKSGGVPEWPKGTDCKSVVVRLRWFKSTPLHHHFSVFHFIDGWWLVTKNCLGCRRQGACRGTTVACGNSSTARASAFQAEGCGFESRFPLHSCIFPFQSSFFLSKHVPWATTQGLMRAVARNREQAFETMLKVESTVTATNFILRETYNGQGKIRTQKAPR